MSIRGEEDRPVVEGNERTIDNFRLPASLLPTARRVSRALLERKTLSRDTGSLCRYAMISPRLRADHFYVASRNKRCFPWSVVAESCTTMTNGE